MLGDCSVRPEITKFIKILEEFFSAMLPDASLLDLSK